MQNGCFWMTRMMHTCMMTVLQWFSNCGSFPQKELHDLAVQNFDELSFCIHILMTIVRHNCKMRWNWQARSQDRFFGGCGTPKKWTFWTQKVDFFEPHPPPCPPTTTPFWPTLWLKVDLLAYLGGASPPAPPWLRARELDTVPPLLWEICKTLNGGGNFLNLLMFVKICLLSIFKEIVMKKWDRYILRNLMRFKMQQQNMWVTERCLYAASTRKTQHRYRCRSLLLL